MDLTEAEDIKKRWQEYTEELYKQTNKHNFLKCLGLVSLPVFAKGLYAYWGTLSQAVNSPAIGLLPAFEEIQS